MFGEPELFAVGSISDAAFCCHFRSSLFVCFCCVGFSLFSSKPRELVGSWSPKWPILCRVGRKALTGSTWLYTLHALYWLIRYLAIVIGIATLVVNNSSVDVYV